ncbi:MAG: stage II sporulation protein M [Candidatus Micrarchaeota archaeon]|nr:stage II sporulation protein M [Candidatus Micrarchaeota archaeon]
MLESLLNFKEISKNPHIALIWAFIVTSVAIFISLQLHFKISLAGGEVIDLTGLFAVIFAVIPFIYLITYTLKKEEKIEEDEIRSHFDEKNILERHFYDMLFFLFLFVGATAAFALWSFLLPIDVFRVQLETVESLQASVSGHIIHGAVSGNAAVQNMAAFYTIMFNNLKVLVFAFIFSLLYGAGAIFIITWNASILGVYIGYLAEHIAHIPVIALGFLPHGIPEIIGYLFAGISGGILSAALIRRHSMSIIKRIFIDCLVLLAIGAFFIVLAAYVEAFL